MKKDLAVSRKIENKIFVIRGKSVMLDRDLAALYGVETKNLNKAVKRNLERFPEEFMFRLTKEEAELSRFQFGTLNKDPESDDAPSRSQIVTLNASSAGKKRGQNIKYLPYAFTEHGVAMLSSVLNSKRAIQINIQIINAFVAIRQYALQARGDERVTNRLSVLEKALLSTDKRVDDIIEVLNNMLEAEEEQKKVKKIGFIK